MLFKNINHQADYSRFLSNRPKSIFEPATDTSYHHQNNKENSQFTIDQRQSQRSSHHFFQPSNSSPQPMPVTKTTTTTNLGFKKIMPYSSPPPIDTTLTNSTSPPPKVLLFNNNNNSNFKISKVAAAKFEQTNKPVAGYITPNLSAATAAAAAALEAAVSQPSSSAHIDKQPRVTRKVGAEMIVNNIVTVKNASIVPTPLLFTSSYPVESNIHHQKQQPTTTDLIMDVSPITNSRVADLAATIETSHASSPPVSSVMDQVFVVARGAEIASGFRRNSFSKSTSSPVRTIAAQKTQRTASPLQTQPSPLAAMATTPDDIEMMSCSSSSSAASSSSSSSSASSSYKENKMLVELEKPPVADETATAADHQRESYQSDDSNCSMSSSKNEPSKLSLSEKMKLFSGATAAAALSSSGGKPAATKSTGAINNRIASNRFSTQVISIVARF